MERLENFKVQLIIVIAAQVLAVVLLFMFDLLFRSSICSRSRSPWPASCSSMS